MPRLGYAAIAAIIAAPALPHVTEPDRVAVGEGEARALARERALRAEQAEQPAPPQQPETRQQRRTRELAERRAEYRAADRARHRRLTP